jgi:isopenicillin-N epimerase
MSPLKDLFLLDPEVVFLNHGSFGATPRPVFDVYQKWQLQLERQPVKFLSVDYPDLDLWARQQLGKYLNADADDVVFVPNATTGINIVARSLSLREGDEVLSTNHEYGACDRIWSFICQKTGAVYKRSTIQLPIISPENVVESLWEGVTAKTQVIFLSHITSPTAQQMPVQEITRRAKEAGILSVIDGAHAPGQIPVDLKDIGADFYAGNLHKWALSPKGAGFLYCRKEIQQIIEPLIVSWGWSTSPLTTTGSTYVDYLLWQGTKDPSASLSVPSAIEFQSNHDWPCVRINCHQHLSEALQRINELTGLPSLYSTDAGFYQMAVVMLPKEANSVILKQRLLDEFRVEVPIIEWEQRKLMRISIQGYNSSSDIETLVNALDKLLPQIKSRDVLEKG